MKRVALNILLLVVLLPAMAGAESYICVTDQSTGFSFNTTQNTWQTTGFHANDKFLVKPNSDQSIEGKWIVLQFGTSVPYASSEYDFSSVGSLRFEGNYGEFAMNRKSLRFVRTYIIGYWTDAVPGMKIVEGEDTPVISIGKCSVLEP